MNAPRRNEPCPCGSGKRYKECHGRIAAEPGGVETLVRSALEAHQLGRVDDAARLYAEILAREPDNPVATHYSGMIAWNRGDVGQAERLMRASIATDAGVADFHNNLALLLRDTGRAEEAVASLRRALAIAPAWRDAHSNLGLALEATGRWDDAIAAYRAALAVDPSFAIARQNLARALLVCGRFAEAWEPYRWRLVAQGTSGSAPDPRARPLAQRLDGKRLVLLAEQGLGDIVFFLRFAPELARRGARLAFEGDARLHAMLQRTGLFELGLRADVSPSAEAERIFIGDLPWLLRADDPASFPPPLALAPDPSRVARVRARLEARGPRPRIALTWRAGLMPAGPARVQLKRIGAEPLAQALRGIPATWISVQRYPNPGEREELERGMGATVHDFSAANEDLEEMLALMSLVDGYVGVSNANVYLRTGAGGGMHVLVPHPPEWRWGVAGDRSPWFAKASVYRQRADGDWQQAMGALRAALTSPGGS